MRPYMKAIPRHTILCPISIVPLPVKPLLVEPLVIVSLVMASFVIASCDVPGLGVRVFIVLFIVLFVVLLVFLIPLHRLPLSRHLLVSKLLRPHDSLLLSCPLICLRGSLGSFIFVVQGPLLTLGRSGEDKDRTEIAGGVIFAPYSEFKPRAPSELIFNIAFRASKYSLNKGLRV